MMESCMGDSYHRMVEGAKALGGDGFARSKGLGRIGFETFLENISLFILDCVGDLLNLRRYLISLES